MTFVSSCVSMCGSSAEGPVLPSRVFFEAVRESFGNWTLTLASTRDFVLVDSDRPNNSPPSGGRVTVPFANGALYAYGYGFDTDELIAAQGGRESDRGLAMGEITLKLPKSWMVETFGFMLAADSGCRLESYKLHGDDDDSRLLRVLREGVELRLGRLKVHRLTVPVPGFGEIPSSTVTVWATEVSDRHAMLQCTDWASAGNAELPKEPQVQALLEDWTDLLRLQPTYPEWAKSPSKQP